MGKIVASRFSLLFKLLDVVEEGCISTGSALFFSGLNRILSGIPRSSFPPVLPNAPIAFLPSDFSLLVTCAFSGQPAIRISCARRIFDQERRRSVLLLSNQVPTIAALEKILLDEAR